MAALLFIQGVGNNVMISTKILFRLFIQVDTPPKLTIHEMFIWRPGRHMIALLTFSFVVCPLG